MAIFCTRVSETGGVVLARIGGEIRSPLPPPTESARRARRIRDRSCNGVRVSSTPFSYNSFVPVTFSDVASRAEALEVALVEEVTAHRERRDVVNDLRRLQPSVPRALGAKRVRLPERPAQSRPPVCVVQIT